MAPTQNPPTRRRGSVRSASPASCCCWPSACCSAWLPGSTCATARCCKRASGWCTTPFHYCASLAVRGGVRVGMRFSHNKRLQVAAASWLHRTCGRHLHALCLPSGSCGFVAHIVDTARMPCRHPGGAQPRANAGASGCSAGHAPSGLGCDAPRCCRHVPAAPSGSSAYRALACRLLAQHFCADRLILCCSPALQAHA